jgi:hypothetical protein
MHAIFSLSPKKLIASGVLTVTVFAGVQARARFEPVEFATATEVAALAKRHGLHCHSGSSSGATWPNLYVADRPLELFDLNALATRRRCGLTPAWRGIVWVGQLRSPGVDLDPESVGGKPRAWGNVVAAGDEELLDQIETMFRNR